MFPFTYSLNPSFVIVDLIKKNKLQKTRQDSLLADEYGQYLEVYMYITNFQDVNAVTWQWLVFKAKELWALEYVENI